MNIARFVAQRIAFNPERTFSRFIIRVAIIATALSVAVMIVALSFTTGFQAAVSQKVFSFWGNIRVENYEPEEANMAEETPILESDSIVHMIASYPSVRSVDAFATKAAMLKTNAGIEGILFKGVESHFHFDRLNAFLRQGRWIHFPDSGYSEEIDLSEYTASQLQVTVGDDLRIYFLQQDAPPRVRKVRLVGIFKTGIEEYDHNFGLGDLNLIRRLNGWDSAEIGGYEVSTTSYQNATMINKSIQQQLPVKWNCETLQQIYPNIFDWLHLQDWTKILLLAIMVLVAVLNLITCLIILVLERVPMVGVLKAVGSTDRMIQNVFLYHATVITTWGIVGGTVLGLGLSWLQQSTGLIKWNEDAYYTPYIPVKIIWWQVVAVDLTTLAICFLALLLPTLLVRKIAPAEAIRFA